MLDHTEDSATQSAKLAELTNKLVMLNEKLKLTGNEWNESKVRVFEAKKTKDINTIIDAQIEEQRFEGKFKEIGADIKTTKEIISSIKYLIKMEKF
jgi:hypothetical protein